MDKIGQWSSGTNWVSLSKKVEGLKGRNMLPLSVFQAFIAPMSSLLVVQNGLDNMDSFNN